MVLGDNHCHQSACAGDIGDLTACRGVALLILGRRCIDAVLVHQVAGTDQNALAVDPANQSEAVLIEHGFHLGQALTRFGDNGIKRVGKGILRLFEDRDAAEQRLVDVVFLISLDALQLDAVGGEQLIRVDHDRGAVTELLDGGISRQHGAVAEKPLAELSDGQVDRQQSRYGNRQCSDDRERVDAARKVELDNAVEQTDDQCDERGDWRELGCEVLAGVGRIRDFQEVRGEARAVLIGDDGLVGGSAAEHLVRHIFVVIDFRRVFLSLGADEAEVVLDAQHHNELAEVIGEEGKQRDNAVVIHIEGGHVAECEEGYHRL